MDNRAEIREFLSSRRARLRPDDAGLPAWGTNRRVPGLRREEVAMLAGVSVDYYTRMERGGLGGVSDSVLHSLSVALQLDEAERAHLSDLAKFANASSGARVRAKRAPKSTVRPELARVLDSISAPGFIVADNRDILAANQLGRALYSEIYTETTVPVNIARFTFLNPRARRFFKDWDQAAATLVGNLRAMVGRHPRDTALAQIVGELSTQSHEFAQLWAAHNVRFHRTGLKILRHPIVGELELSYETMELPADPGASLNVYTTEPGSPSADALALLASWAATNEPGHAGIAPKVLAIESIEEESI